MIRNIRKSGFWHGAWIALFAIGAASAGENGDSGFRPLFNGKNLQGWMTKGNWTVTKSGALYLKPRSGETGWKRYGSYLWTQKKFGDFVLALEYKHPKKGNSGVFVRVADVKTPVNKGVEVQIIDSYGRKGKLNFHDFAGGIIRGPAPSKNVAKPAGQWNRMVVTCRKYNLQVVLNGEKIINMQLDKSKLKDRPLVGYIGIQDHGQPFWVRNIKIKELK